MNSASYALEIVATSIEDAAAAVRGGATRLELCHDLSCGGVTPDVRFLAAMREFYPDLDMRVLFRPHGGPFVLNKDEVVSLAKDIAAAKQLGYQGIVIGALDQNGDVDRSAMQALLEAAQPMQATFHRAFDALQDKERAVEELIALGFDRVLTSGGKGNAWDHRNALRGLYVSAQGRIGILPGGGVRSTHAAALLAETGVRELHSSARTSSVPCVDEAEVRALLVALRTALHIDVGSDSEQSG